MSDKKHKTQNLKNLIQQHLNMTFNEESSKRFDEIVKQLDHIKEEQRQKTHQHDIQEKTKVIESLSDTINKLSEDLEYKPRSSLFKCTKNVVYEYKDVLDAKIRLLTAQCTFIKKCKKYADTVCLGKANPFQKLENIKSVCNICIEDMSMLTVSHFKCGHTVCINCLKKIVRCNMCRSSIQTYNMFVQNGENVSLKTFKNEFLESATEYMNDMDYIYDESA